MPQRHTFQHAHARYHRPHPPASVIMAIM
jgi:hypothetical protein